MGEYVGKPNHWFTKDSKLLRSDASVVCEVKLPVWFNLDSKVTIDQRTYEFHDRNGTHLWFMIHEHKVVCRARMVKSWLGWCNLFILEELDEAGNVKYKAKMRPYKCRGGIIYLYKAPLNSSDEQMLVDPDGLPVIGLWTKFFQPDIYVSVNDNSVSDVFLGYVFMIYKMIFRNR